MSNLKQKLIDAQREVDYWSHRRAHTAEQIPMIARKLQQAKAKLERLKEENNWS